MNVFDLPGDKDYMVLLDREDFPEYWPVVAAFLCSQPTSWQETNTLDGFRMSLEDYKHKAVLIGHKDTWAALVLFVIYEVEQGRWAMQVDFLTCDGFFSNIHLYEVIERIAKSFNCHFIEAHTHPTIAKYLTKKRGFTAPAVYVRKALYKERML